MDISDSARLEELRLSILATAIDLVRKIDSYTALKGAVTGVHHNIVSEFRGDAYTVAVAAANEFVNSEEGVFTLRDSLASQDLLDSILSPVFGK